MKEELLNRIRDNYEYLKKRRENSEKMVNRLLELEQNSVVQEYLRLKADYGVYCNGVKMLSDDDLIEISFRGNAFDIDETNCIYVCVGEYMLSDLGLCKRYVNVENSRDSHLIPLKDTNKFEMEHKIVFVTKKEKKSIFLYDNKYDEVQRDFLREAVNFNQEKACRKILSKKY